MERIREATSQRGHVIKTAANRITLRITMGRFVEKYTAEQREAAATAYVDRNLGSYAYISRLAAEAGLEYNGRQLEPFDMPPSSVQSYARQLRKRRAGDVESQLSTNPDGPQIVKRRLLAMCDKELAAEERKKDGTRDLERMRQIARAAREADAIRDKNDPRKPPVGEMNGGAREGGDTAGGLGGQILAAANMGGRTHAKADD